MMKEQNCCFTGHRNIPLSERPQIKKRLAAELLRLVDCGVHCFIAGGALGFDTLAALAVLRLREQHPFIQLILMLPCKEQTRGWPENDKERYRQIVSESNEVIYPSDHYFSSCMHKRNRCLIDNRSFCICYLTRPSGGTAYTVSYAKAQGLTVVNLAK